MVVPNSDSKQNDACPIYLILMVATLYSSQCRIPSSSGGRRDQIS